MTDNDSDDLSNVIAKGNAIYNLANVASGTFLDIDAGGYVVCNPFVRDSESQSWRLLAVGGDFLLQNCRNGQRLTREGDDKQCRTLFKQPDDKNQIWRIIKLPLFPGFIFTDQGKYCLDLSHGRSEPNSKVILYKHDARNSNQMWSLRPVIPARLYEIRISSSDDLTMSVQGDLVVCMSTDKSTAQQRQWQVTAGQSGYFMLKNSERQLYLGQTGAEGSQCRVLAGTADSDNLNWRFDSDDLIKWKLVNKTSFLTLNLSGNSVIVGKQNQTWLLNYALYDTLYMLRNKKGGTALSGSNQTTGQSFAGQSDAFWSLKPGQPGYRLLSKRIAGSFYKCVRQNGAQKICEVVAEDKRDDNQNWAFIGNGDIYDPSWHVANKADRNLRLDLRDGNSRNGTDVLAYPGNNNPQQLWITNQVLAMTSEYEPGLLTIGLRSQKDPVPIESKLKWISEPSGHSGEYTMLGAQQRFEVNFQAGGAYKVYVDGQGGCSEIVRVVTEKAPLVRVVNSGNEITGTLKKAPGFDLTSIEIGRAGVKPEEPLPASNDTFSKSMTATGDDWYVLSRGVDFMGSSRSFGPGSREPIVTQRTVLKSVQYTGASIEAAWEKAPTLNRYRATATKNGITQASVDVGTLSHTFMGAGEGLNWQVYVLVESEDAVSQGLPCPAVDVVRATTRITSAVYQPPNLALKWEPVPPFNSYRVTVSREDGTRTWKDTNDTQIVLVGDFKPRDDIYVQVQSADGVSRGPESAVAKLILAAPTLLSFSYDGTNAVIQWQNPKLEDVTDTLLRIDGRDPPLHLGKDGTVTIPLSLDPRMSNSATLQATRGPFVGPKSDPIPLVATSPAGIHLGFDGGQLVGVWTPFSLGPAAATRYEAWLSADGTRIKSRESTTPLVVFDTSLKPGVLYSLEVRATVDKATGPYSAPVYGPYAADQVLHYDGFGRLKSVQWTGHGTMSWTYDAAGNLLDRTFLGTSGEGR